MKRSHWNRLALITVILAISIAVRFARLQLVGVQSENLTAWPAQVIFGLYFTIFTLAVQALWQIREGTDGDHSRQALFLLMLIGDCLDMVLVNVQETNRKVDASYGLVVLWDIATFFAWFRAIDLSRPEKTNKFCVAWTVTVAPLLALGREILFLPYSWPGGAPPGEPWLAYLDLFFYHFLTALWVFIPLVPQSRPLGPIRPEGRVEQMLVLCVFVGAAYGIVSAAVNTIQLAWAPSETYLYRVFDRWGIPVSDLNVLQFILALCATLTLRYKDAFGLGTSFGITGETERRKIR